MPSRLLATKLHIPRLRRDMVHRPRLMERLDAALQGKLTLVSAPAGYGKTTLVSEWVNTAGADREPPLHIAWLSIDEADNDLIRFLTYVVAALQRIDETIGVDVQAALAESQAPPVEAMLTRLVSDIAAAGDRGPREFVLALDDYHLIATQAVHEALSFLLENLPESMHLLIAGRSDPPLPISRLRVQGTVTEIRTPDLRFTEGEVAAFLNDLMGLDLLPGDIAALEARTEGWIASLQLAAIALRSMKEGQSPVPLLDRPDKHEFVAAFSGSHRYVIDYLIDEVLSRQSDEIQAFLRHTSILDRFCAELCDVVLEKGPGLEVESGTKEDVQPPSGVGDHASRCQTILEQLERANLFLIPLDDERRWYRYHHLFASFLQQHQRKKEPERIAELHRRASQWYEENGLVDEAIQHALTGGDTERATRLVDGIAASLVMRREPNKLLRLVNQLPPDQCGNHRMLCLWHAWALVFAGDLEAVEPILRIAEAQRGKGDRPPLPGYATTIRAYLANRRGDVAKALDLSRRALEQMSDAPSGETTLIFQGAAVIWLGVNHRLLGDLGTASRLYAEACSLNREAGNIYAALSSLAELGDLALIQGQLHRAVELYRQGLEMARRWSEDEGIRRTVLAASSLHLRLGTVLYQWNDLVAAGPHIERAVELDELGEAWGRMLSYRMLAYLKRAEADYQAAYDLLSQACSIRHNLSVHQMNVAAEPSLEQLRVLLSRDQPEMAHLLTDAAQRIKVQGLSPDDDVTFAGGAGYTQEPQYSDLARVLIGLGRAADALPLLERLLDTALSMGRQGDAIRYLVMQAVAFHAERDTSSALAGLDQALTLAEPEGYVRIFVDEGEPMAALLAQAVRQGIAPDYASDLLAAFPAQVRQDGELDAGVPASAQPLIDPLSERELEVLRLMAVGLKYREVADELVISLNTVRHHTRNIYGKLGVSSRARAVGKEKDLGLL